MYKIPRGSNSNHGTPAFIQHAVGPLAVGSLGLGCFNAMADGSINSAIVLCYVLYVFIYVYTVQYHISGLNSR